MKRTIFLITLLVFCVTSLFAQAPEKFSFQAVVRNANNQLVTNAPVSVRLSILQGSTDGETLYMETHFVATNANGLMTVEVGGGKALQGTFEDINWANGPFFLKTETDPNGGENYSIESVQQLLSVPYALYAKEAGNSFSGDYNDLKNKPVIPQNVGELANDAGYITLNDLPGSPKGDNTPKGTGVIQTDACGEIDLCQFLNRFAQIEAALLPSVTTGTVSNVSETSATCGGTVTANGYSAVTVRGVCWDTVTTPTVEGSHTSNGSGTGTFTSTLTNLTPNTTYYVRAYATSSVGTAYGEEVIFTTEEEQEDTCTIVTLPYSENFDNYTTSTSAETGVQPDCWNVITEDVALTASTKPQLYHGYATSGSYSLRMKNRCIYAMPKLNNNISIGDLTMTFNLRQPKSIYRLQVGVMDEMGEFNVVKTINNASTNIEAVSIDFSNYTGSGHQIAFRNTLIKGSTLEYSINYIDDIIINGIASASLPTVISGSVSSITATTASCDGTVIADGGATVTECGICWGVNTNPTIAGNHTAISNPAVGTFTVNISGLTSGTTYFVRAYATNSEGTAYGEDVSFTTVDLQDTCATIALPYIEKFDSYTTSTTAATGVEPTCWYLVQADAAMTDASRPQLYYKSSYAHSGNYSLRMSTCGIYAMPALSENVQLKHVQLEMYLRQTNAAYQLQVGVWEDNGTFVPITTFNNNTTNTELVECDFANYTGSGRRIAFRNINSSGNAYSYNYIDDVSLNVLMPQGYYDNAVNKSGYTLRVALHDIIKNHDTLSYNDLWQSFYSTDKRPDNNKVWDIYSDKPGNTAAYYFTFGSNQCGSYSVEGDCYNREHSVPNSWFGGSVAPMYTDLFHLFPTDGYVNSKRSNLPIGKVTSASWTSTNGSKVGTSNISGYSGQVFEPIDSFKGDFARTYFYMAVCYMDKNLGVETQSNFSGGDLKPWAKQLLLQWAALDPVSRKEIDRNNAVYEIQHNRNPFIDYPELIEKVFGNDSTPFTTN